MSLFKYIVLHSDVLLNVTNDFYLQAWYAAGQESYLLFFQCSSALPNCVHYLNSTFAGRPGMLA